MLCIELVLSLAISSSCHWVEKGSLDFDPTISPTGLKTLSQRSDAQNNDDDTGWLRVCIYD